MEGMVFSYLFIFVYFKTSDVFLGFVVILKNPLIVKMVHLLTKYIAMCPIDIEFGKTQDVFLIHNLRTQSK